MSKGTLMLNGVDYSNGGLGGNPANNYSTEEQVIGTWIDGKPLYQKTIVLKNQHLESFSDLTIETFNSEINAIDIKGYLYHINYSSSILINSELAISNKPSLIVSARLENSNGVTNVKLRASGAWFDLDDNRNDIYCIIQYTKTTD